MADILIVEDNPDISELMREFLVDEGHSVRLASNGEEGLVAMGEKMPQLILLDIEMPVLDGPGMAVKILVHDAGYEDVPIIVLSGAADVQIICEKIGTPYFLTKPFKIAPFLEMVSQVLQNGKGIRRIEDHI